MAIDYSLVYECNPKRHFGNGDSIKGSADILERLKAVNRASMLRQMAQKEGRDPYSVPLDLIMTGADGRQIKKEIFLSDLEAHIKPLADNSGSCDGCPAKCIEQAYGCFGCIHYPISAKAEDWLLSRLQPCGTIGAEMCFDIITQLGITGGQAASMRQRGFFETTQAKKITLKKSLFKSQSITADQLFESMFMVGNPLYPDHCRGLLIWFGAMMLDGRVLAGLHESDMASLVKFINLTTTEAKAQCTQPVLGPQSDSEEVMAFEAYFRALYLSWFYDVPLLVSA
jgi:hypothetical protein